MLCCHHVAQQKSAWRAVNCSSGTWLWPEYFKHGRCYYLFCCPYCCYCYALQGMEKDIIILATTITHGGAFASDVQRVNVALTRARHHLLVLGCSPVLRSCSAAFRMLLASCPNMPAAGGLPIRSAAHTVGHHHPPMVGLQSLQPTVAGRQPDKIASRTPGDLQSPPSVAGEPGPQPNSTEGQPTRSALRTPGEFQSPPSTVGLPGLDPHSSGGRQPVRSHSQPADQLQDAPGNMTRQRAW